MSVRTHGRCVNIFLLLCVYIGQFEARQLRICISCQKRKKCHCDVGVQTVVKTVDFLLVSFRVNFAACFRFVYKLQGNVTVKSYSVNSQSESTVGEKSETVTKTVREV